MAKFLDGTPAEMDIDLNITVVDVNDCPPVIKAQQVGFVNESSAAGILRHLQYSIFVAWLREKYSHFYLNSS